MELIEFRRGELWVDSHMVASKFGMEHNKVIRSIDRTLARFEKLRLPIGTARIVKEERKYQGQSYTAYLMNRPMFSLVAQRFETKRALEWQVRFNDEFYNRGLAVSQATSNASNPAWLENRQQGKLVRREETDIIQEFVEYATTQGSKSAIFYYKHITNSVYRALNLMAQRKPKLRESMNYMEISQLAVAEKITRDSLIKHMNSEKHYKEIYKAVNADLIAFGGLLRLAA